ncbi:MAG: recombination protein O N-terminal domain-containing protein, partial [Bacteroidales bacterium]|nr:recombination protein O N-terminal domain-containing protein [Bacteroidales bacterium]
MILTTQGLVLHTTKYGETSIIAKVFTRELGLCSYIIKGIRSSSGRTKQNLMQPLSHLEMTVYNNPKKQLQYIKEMR